MSLRNPLQKMSKSDNQEASRINLTDSPDELRKKIRKAVTDSTGRITYDPIERPGVSNLVSIYAALADLSHDEVCERYADKQTVDMKNDLSEVVVEKLGPISENIHRLERDIGYVDQVLREGADKARTLAEENMKGIMKLMGVA